MTAGAEPAVLTRLRAVPLFAGLSSGELQRLAASVTRVRVPAGATLMGEGDPGDSLYILLRGGLEVTRHVDGEEVLLARQKPGAFVGEMALLGGSPRNATVRSTRRSEVLRVDAAAFRELLAIHPDAAVRVLGAVTRRLARTERVLRRRESLASLGTIAAGLAHELNNPAAAMASSAPRLRRRLAELGPRAARLGPQQLAAAEDMVQPCTPGPAAPSAPDARDPLLRLLRDRGVSVAAAAAHALHRHGWTADQLEQRLAAHEPALHRPLLEYLEVRCEVAALSAELEAAARAISGTVAAVRAHVAANPEPLVPVRLRDSVDAALLVAAPRLRSVGVSVREARALPSVAGHHAELVQVWANLVVNAVDAGASTVSVRLRRRGGEVEVAVCDDGRGVPARLLRRIFEPFVTGRPGDGGTGLGLHIVRTIVERHGGRVRVRSRPGRTEFRVRLPAVADGT